MLRGFGGNSIGHELHTVACDAGGSGGVGVQAAELSVGPESGFGVHHRDAFVKLSPNENLISLSATIDGELRWVIANVTDPSAVSAHAVGDGAMGEGAFPSATATAPHFSKQAGAAYPLEFNAHWLSDDVVCAVNKAETQTDQHVAWCVDFRQPEGARIIPVQGSLSSTSLGLFSTFKHAGGNRGFAAQYASGKRHAGVINLVDPSDAASYGKLEVLFTPGPSGASQDSFYTSGASGVAPSWSDGDDLVCFSMDTSHVNSVGCYSFVTNVGMLAGNTGSTRQAVSFAPDNKVFVKVDTSFEIMDLTPAAGQSTGSTSPVTFTPSGGATLSSPGNTYRTDTLVVQEYFATDSNSQQVTRYFAVNMNTEVVVELDPAQTPRWAFGIQPARVGPETIVIGTYDDGELKAFDLTDPSNLVVTDVPNSAGFSIVWKSLVALGDGSGPGTLQAMAGLTDSAVYYWNGDQGSMIQVTRAGGGSFSTFLGDSIDAALVPGCQDKDRLVFLHALGTTTIGVSVPNSELFVATVPRDNPVGNQNQTATAMLLPLHNQTMDSDINLAYSFEVHPAIGSGRCAIVGDMNSQFQAFQMNDIRCAFNGSQMLDTSIWDLNDDPRDELGRVLTYSTTSVQDITVIGGDGGVVMRGI